MEQGVSYKKWKYLRGAFMEKRNVILKEKSGSAAWDVVKAKAEKWRFYKKLEFLNVVKSVNHVAEFHFFRGISRQFSLLIATTVRTVRQI